MQKKRELLFWDVGLACYISFAGAWGAVVAPAEVCTGLMEAGRSPRWGKGKADWCQES